MKNPLKPWLLALLLPQAALLAQDAPGSAAPPAAAKPEAAPGEPAGEDGNPGFAPEREPPPHEAIAADAPGYVTTAPFIAPEFDARHFDFIRRSEDPLTEFISEGADEPLPGLLQPRDEALHARIGARWAPRELAGRSRQYDRPGLGGYSNPDGSSTLATDLSLAGTIKPGRLFFSVRYAPQWSRDYYRYATDPADAARDQITLPDANRTLPAARGINDLSQLELRWTPHPGHTFSYDTWNSPWRFRGRRRLGAYRTRAGDDTGIVTDPALNGAPDTPPADGEQAALLERASGWILAYRAEMPHGWRLETSVSDHRSTVDESPAPSADTVSYDDIRRAQVYAVQRSFNVPTLTTPAQYRFGGLGMFEAATGEQTLDYRLTAGRDAHAGGDHELRLTAQLEMADFHENQLRSGPRGDAGPEVALRRIFGGNIARSVIRVRSGFTAQVNCPRVNPFASDFITACGGATYVINHADLNPLMRDDNRRDMRFGASDLWTLGRLQLGAVARYDRVSISSPNRYTLHSDVTGQILTGADGYPVGSRVEDVPYSPIRPIPPAYTEGAGIFVGGAYQFPAAWSGRATFSWNLSGDDRVRLYGAAGRDTEEVAPDLAMHAFENTFGIASVSFANPDMSVQLTPASTFGGGTTLIAPGTRQGYTDRWKLGVDWAVSPALRLTVQARGSRLGRALVQSQANSVENIANFTYDFYLVNDATFGSRYCLNCAPGQTTLFPGYVSPYPTGNLFAPNPDARSYLSETLSNPGENTPAGLFPKPEKRTTEVAAAMEWKPAGTPFSVQASGRYYRARGNFTGMFTQSNGLGHPELASMYLFPLSHLTRSIYAGGPIEDQPPEALQLVFATERLGLPGLRGALRGRWSRGLPRTPLISAPGKQFEGTLPGLNPSYYQFDLDLDGRVDRLVLKDFEAVPRGALGHNPDSATLDALLDWDHPLRDGTLSLSLEIRNLFNDRRNLAYDDQVESRVGFVALGGVAPVAAPNGPLHDEPPSDPTPRGLNPAYGQPTTAQSARAIELAAGWKF